LSFSLTIFVTLAELAQSMDGVADECLFEIIEQPSHFGAI